MEVSLITIAAILQALFFLLISTLWFFFSSRRSKKHVASLREICNESTDLAKKAQTKIIQLKAQLKHAQNASGPASVMADVKQEFDYGRHIEASLLINEQRIETLGGDPNKYDTESNYDLRVSILRNWYLKAELDGFFNKEDAKEFWASLNSKLAIVFEHLGNQPPTADASEPPNIRNTASQSNLDSKVSDLESQLAEKAKIIQEISETWALESKAVQKAYDSLIGDIKALEDQDKMVHQAKRVHDLSISLVSHIPNVTTTLVTTPTTATITPPMERIEVDPNSSNPETVNDGTHILEENTDPQNSEAPPSEKNDSTDDLLADILGSVEVPDVPEIEIDDSPETDSENIQLDPIVGEDEPLDPLDEIKAMIDTGSEDPEPEELESTMPESTGVEDDLATSDSQTDNPTQTPKSNSTEETEELDKEAQDLLDELFKDD